MNTDRVKQLSEFQKRIGVKFTDDKIIDAALTHSSYSNQYGLNYNDHNERLEFLGDSVLSIIISEQLYKKYMNKKEGKLTRIRAGLVCEPSLAEAARRLGVNSYLRMGKGEELSGGREKDSLIADAFEAIIAAIYLDRGYEVARDFVLKNFDDKIDMYEVEDNLDDYKTRLQEYVQSKLQVQIRYEIVSESGPDHNKLFEAKVFLDNKSFGHGNGKSKKEAEQSAAKEALLSLGVNL